MQGTTVNGSIESLNILVKGRTFDMGEYHWKFASEVKLQFDRCFLLVLDHITKNYEKSLSSVKSRMLINSADPEDDTHILKCGLFIVGMYYSVSETSC